MSAASSLVDRPMLAFLDADGSPSLGRFAFVASDPVEVVRADADRDPFDVIAHVCRGADESVGSACPLAPRDVPSWIGFVAYEAAAPSHPSARGPAVPDALFARYDAVAAFDLVSGEAWLVGDDAAALDRLEARLAAPPREVRARVSELHAPDPHLHTEGVARVLEHIARGDVYQVNLARCFHGTFDGDPLALFFAMREASAVPFGFFLDVGGTPGAPLAVLGRSMERFVRWDRGSRRIESRPIKGTVARLGDDAHEASTLRGSEKERAEHAMIVDLVRNDLGRVAEVGTVRVEALLAIEPYAKLSHMVSTIAATTRPEVSAVDVVRATFPPGSVTGAPKIRAMEIIAALEPEPRGVYCGATGFVDRAGGLALAVAIRTAQIVGDDARYHAGGGLVWASDPSAELAETELKARVFFDAVERLARST